MDKMQLNNENQIRTLLTKFLAEHGDYNYEKGQSQVFWSDFFHYSIKYIYKNIDKVYFI